MDSDLLDAFRCLYVYMTVAANGEIELGYLISLRQVRIKIILSVELIIPCDLAVKRKACLDRKLNYSLVKSGKSARHA
jgi:hypothetical protein